MHKNSHVHEHHQLPPVYNYQHAVNDHVHMHTHTHFTRFTRTEIISVSAQLVAQMMGHLRCETGDPRASVATYHRQIDSMIIIRNHMNMSM